MQRLVVAPDAPHAAAVVVPDAPQAAGVASAEDVQISVSIGVAGAALRPRTH